MLAVGMLHAIIKKGRLRVIDDKGTATDFGDGSGPAVTMHLHDRRALRALLFNPKLATGELYMDERLTFEEGTLCEFLELVTQNITSLRNYPLYQALGKLDRLLTPLQTLNPIPQARKNVAHHYDLSAKLYELFLDQDRQYSCAYFTRPDLTLEEAQAAKKAHIAGKLYLNRPGLAVLDIGSGWGGMALTLARDYEAQVQGVTLSQEQLKISRERVKEQGLGEKVSFYLQDYRLVEGHFDRIVSIGMFEHVGPRNYLTFFRKVAELLKDDGVCLLHSIGSIGGPGATNPWLRKYIFPGGYTPALSEVTPMIERAGLWITDIEIWRNHYAQTLRHWRTRFEKNRKQIEQLYDARFCRMWDFYLTACEISFRGMGQMVFQIQIAKSENTVPITRDYLYSKGESALQADSSRRAAE